MAGGKRARLGRPGGWKTKARLLDELEAGAAAREEAHPAMKEAMQETAAVLRLASGYRASAKAGEGLRKIEVCARTALERLGVADLALERARRGSDRDSVRRPAPRR